MIARVLCGMGGIIVGLVIGYLVVFHPLSNGGSSSYLSPLAVLSQPTNKEIIGFLPFWLTNKASADYSKDITTLAYFSLTPDTDGSIKKLTNPQEEDPGWYSLTSGKMDTFFSSARQHGEKLSLVVFSGDNDAITGLMDDPVPHATNLLHDVIPVMQKYQFMDLNLDIEQTADASAAARMHFTQFVKTIKETLDRKHLGTLTVDISPTDLIKPDLIDPVAVAPLVDHVVIMAYDYHYAGSSVTGPVAPVGGAGTESEYDTQTALEKALSSMPSEKIILGSPLYGYEWETLGTVPRSAVIPGTGLIASSDRVAGLLSSCATCALNTDTTAQEAYVIYKDSDTGTYHQLFFPDQNAMQVKVALAENNHLGGIALWALGYEDSTLLKPLVSYKSPLSGLLH